MPFLTLFFFYSRHFFTKKCDGFNPLSAIFCFICSYSSGEHEKENALIYCDIPYKNTDGYDSDFDYERFYSWAEVQTEPVIISEYAMPENRFICIAQKEKTITLQGGSKYAIEKLFVPKIQIEKGIFKREWIK